MTNSDGSKVLRVVLIVLAVVAGTSVLCCGGLYLAGVRVAEEVEKAIGPIVEGSGIAARQERLVEGFDAIRVDGVIDVDVKIGEPTVVVLQADDNLLPVLTTEVVEGTLVFSARQAYDAKTDVRAVVTLPALRSLTVEGVGDVTVRGLDEKAFSVTVRGVGSATVHGRTDALDVRVEGVGSAHLAELEARTVRAKVLGVGDAEVHAIESLDADVEGMGDVVYHGSPGDVRRRVQGMGDVIPAE